MVDEDALEKQFINDLVEIKKSGDAPAEILLQQIFAAVRLYLNVTLKEGKEPPKHRLHCPHCGEILL